MMLSQPMIVSVPSTFVCAVPGDFTVAGRLAGFLTPVEVAEVAGAVVFAALSGAALITAGVDETDAVATESAFDAPPG